MGGGSGTTSPRPLRPGAAVGSSGVPTAAGPGPELDELGQALEHVRVLLERVGGISAQPEHGPLLVGPDGRVAYTTPWFEHMFGIPAAALRGAAFADLTAWLGLGGLETEPATDGATTCTLVHPDGTRRSLRLSVVRLVSSDGHFLGTLRSFHDVTAMVEPPRELAEKSRLLDDARARLTRAQHLKALGQLAAEVAHEFGNLLQAIGLQAAALRRQPALPKTVTRALLSIKQAVDMGQALTRRLLTFARDDPHKQMEPLDVGRVVHDLVQLLEPRIHRKSGRPVRVELALPELPAMRGDQTKLTEAFLNVFLNALDAMPDGGALHVSAVERSGEIRIAVRDTGTGMSREEAQRAFDPFFTTKPGGTGLGLSTVYGVVREHGGSVFLESEPGRGTTVFISLPTTTPPAIATPPAGAPAAPAAERVLVVDDHPTVRAATSDLLAADGYQVEHASSAPPAHAPSTRPWPGRRSP